jgi:hypothetical protein
VESLTSYLSSLRQKHVAYIGLRFFLPSTNALGFSRKTWAAIGSSTSCVMPVESDDAAAVTRVGIENGVACSQRVSHSC